MIKENPRVTISEMAGVIGKSVRTIKRKLSEMENVRFIGSGPGGKWEIIE